MGTLQKNPTRRHMLNVDREEQIRREEERHLEHLKLMDSFDKLQQQMSVWEAEREAEREAQRSFYARQIEEIMRARDADKEAFRQEIQALLAGQAQAALQQVLLMQNVKLPWS